MLDVNALDGNGQTKQSTARRIMAYGRFFENNLPAQNFHENIALANNPHRFRGAEGEQLAAAFDHVQPAFAHLPFQQVATDFPL